MIKVIGLQRTGTNWVQRLLAKNFTDDVEFHGEKPCWKHALPSEIDPNDLETLRAFNIVLVLKRPEAWFHSIYRSRIPAWKRQLERNRPELFADGEIRPRDAARLYERFYSAWLGELTTGDTYVVAFVRYEDLLSDLDENMAIVGLNLGLTRASLIFENIDQVPQSMPWTPELTSFYLGDDFGLTTEQQAAVDSIDCTLLKTMGYK